MIHESYYWRKELTKISKKLLQKIDVKKDWSDSKYAKFEKEIMLGFYIIRKLLESNKLTNKIGSAKFKIKEYSNNGTQLTRLNNHRFHEYYDLENPRIIKRDLKFLINQFVHSYIFSPVINLTNEDDLKLMDGKSEENQIEIYKNGDKNLTSVMVNTDTGKNKSLYEINIDEIIRIFNDVGNCNVTRIEMKFNSMKGDYEAVQFDDEFEISDETKVLIEKFNKE